MTVTLDLTPDMEQRLREQERLRGQDPTQTLREMVRGLLSAPEAPAATLPPRIAGLNRGQLRASPDFDEPLPDEFWLGAP